MIRRVLPLIAFFTFSFTSFAQHTLRVEISGASELIGEMSVAIYNQKDTFLDFKRVYKAKTQKVYNATNLLSFTNLEQGEYAIAVFHDANANQKLDKNFLGIPKEALGFSIGKMKAFGPPTFEECKFVLDENKTIKIELSKW